MASDPFLRFLGVERTASPWRWLDLPETGADRLAVERALHRRLEQIFRHPDGRSSEAEQVRSALREAAQTLVQARHGSGPTHRPRTGPAPARRRRAIEPAALTEFDRLVMAALVAGGGWNARSRGRLVSLAAAHGVSPAGLMRVVAGLNSLASAGDGSQPATVVPPRRLAARSGGRSRPVHRVYEPKKERNEFLFTIKLSIIFGLITLVAGAVAVVMVWPDPRAPVEPPGPDPVVRAAPPSPAPAGPDPRLEERVLRFRPIPTFIGNAVPPAAVNAADATATLPDELDEVARKLSITDTPSEAVYRNWEVSIETTATGWVLVDGTTRDRVRRGIVTALREAADSAQGNVVTERMLAALVPPRRLAEAEDVWRGAWKSAMLGELAGGVDLPPVVVQRARNLLAIALPETPAAERRSFDGAAWAWLGDIIDELVRTVEIDPRAYDAWELWLAAQRTLDAPDRAERHRLDALQALMSGDTDLGRPGPTVNVVARLLSLSDFEGSPVVRDAVAVWFEDESIAAHDLWVVTSLLVQLDTAPWFDDTLVLPDQADQAFRNRVRDRITGRWPEMLAATDPVREDGFGLDIDEALADRWLEHVATHLVRPVPVTPEATAAELAVLVHLGEAAALIAVRRDREAGDTLDVVRDLIAADPLRPPPVGNSAGGGGPARRGGSARSTVGGDGQWAASYLAARRDPAERIQRLRALTTAAGADLGPLDAEMLVREAYRAGSAEVRQLARQIVVEQFGDGRIVAVEMLDQFPDAPTSEHVAELLREYTGQILPAPRSADWPLAARRALVEHALDRLAGGSNALDTWAAWTAESLAHRTALVRGEPVRSYPYQAPEEIAARLTDAWRERAELMLAEVPTPADLSTLARRRETRRRLADGPLQLLVAEQLSLIELLAYVTAAERPSRRERVNDILTRSAIPRREAPTALAQAVEAERALLRLWVVRFDRVPRRPASEDAS